MSETLRLAVVWIVALGLLLLGARAWAAGPAAHLPLSADPEVTAAVESSSAEYARPEISVIISRNPFRFDRRAVRPEGTEPASATEAVQSAPYVPAMRVRGLVGGPPWTVILEGVPGAEAGVVMSPGDSIGGVRLVRVSADTVFVAISDSLVALLSSEVPR